MPRPDSTAKPPKRRASPPAAVALLRVQHALSVLGSRGVLNKGKSARVSARLDPGLIEAARAKLGAASDTELLTAALAIVAGDDDFGAWLVTRGERLPADFELEF